MSNIDNHPKYQTMKKFKYRGCVLLLSAAKKQLVMTINIFDRAINRKEKIKIRKPVILIADGNELILTQKEWRKTIDLTGKYKAKYLYDWDKRRRFEEEIPIESFTKKRTQRIINKANVAGLRNNHLNNDKK